jgi:hypothetical protein
MKGAPLRKGKMKSAATPLPGRHRRGRGLARWVMLAVVPHRGTEHEDQQHRDHEQYLVLRQPHRVGFLSRWNSYFPRMNRAKKRPLDDAFFISSKTAGGTSRYR